MKINPINVYNHYNKNSANNTNFQGLYGCDKIAISELTAEELKWLSNYVNKLRNTKHCDFKIIQHPHRNYPTPAISLRFPKSVKLNSLLKVEPMGRGTIRRTEHNVSGTNWLECVEGISFTYIDTTKIEFREFGKLYPEYSFPKSEDFKIEQIAKDLYNENISDVSRNYHFQYYRYPFERLFNGITLIDAIERYHNKLCSAISEKQQYICNLLS